MPLTPGRATGPSVPFRLNFLPADPGWACWRLYTTSNRTDRDTLDLVLSPPPCFRAWESEDHDDAFRVLKGCEYDYCRWKKSMAGPIGLINILTSSELYTACTDISLKLRHTGIHKPETWHWA